MSMMVTCLDVALWWHGDDVKLPEGEVGEQIKAAFEEGRDLFVAVIAAMGEEQAMSFRMLQINVLGL